MLKFHGNGPSPFAERAFRLLFSASSISLVGSAVAPIALAFGMLQATGSATDLGIVLTAREAVQLVLLLFGGVVSDRVSRHRVLAWSNCVSAVAQGATGALFLTHHVAVWDISILAALNGAATAFLYPAFNGAVPSTVPAEALRQANTYLGLSESSVTVIGSAVGGALVAVLGPGLAIEIDALSFLVAAGLVALMRLPAAQRDHARSTLQDLRQGWSAFWSRSWLWSIVLQFSIVNMAFVGAVDVLVPIDARRFLGGPAAYGALFAAVGVGSVVGGLVMLRVAPRRPLLTATICTGVGMPPVFLLLALGAPLWALLLAAAVAGAGFQVFGVLWTTTMQEQIPSALLSRVSSYDAVGSFVFMPLGLALAGPVEIWIGLHAAFWAALALSTIPTVAILLVPSVRRLERRSAPSMAE
ncbi:MAG: MFS transporter [Candidatus Dormibacteria bacterium]